MAVAQSVLHLHLEVVSLFGGQAICCLLHRRKIRRDRVVAVCRYDGSAGKSVFVQSSLEFENWIKL